MLLVLSLVKIKNSFAINFGYPDILSINLFLKLNKFNKVKDSEVNNSETFQRLLEIYFFNNNNFRLEFSFEETGMCKIVKLNKNNLNNIKFNIPCRKYTL